MAVDLREPTGSVQTAPRTPKQNHGKQNNDIFFPLKYFVVLKNPTKFTAN